MWVPRVYKMWLFGLYHIMLCVRVQTCYKYKRLGWARQSYSLHVRMWMSFWLLGHGPGICIYANKPLTHDLIIGHGFEFKIFTRIVAHISYPPFLKSWLHPCRLTGTVWSIYACPQILHQSFRTEAPSHTIICARNWEVIGGTRVWAGRTTVIPLLPFWTPAYNRGKKKNCKTC